MFKEFLKDCKYIWFVISKESKLMISVKITLIPLLLSFLTYIFGGVTLPKWAAILVGIFYRYNYAVVYYCQKSKKT